MYLWYFCFDLIYSLILFFALSPLTRFYSDWIFACLPACLLFDLGLLLLLLWVQVFTVDRRRARARSLSYNRWMRKLVEYEKKTRASSALPTNLSTSRELNYTYLGLAFHFGKLEYWNNFNNYRCQNWYTASIIFVILLIVSVWFSWPNCEFRETKDTIVSSPQFSSCVLAFVPRCAARYH